MQLADFSVVHINRGRKRNCSDEYSLLNDDIGSLSLPTPISYLFHSFGYLHHLEPEMLYVYNVLHVLYDFMASTALIALM